MINRIVRRKVSLVVVISGPSGAGKSTIAKEVILRNKDSVFSVSYTTREKRVGEKDKKDYFFVDEKKFNDMIKEDRFLEYASVHGHFYGTPKEEVLNNLKKNKNVVLDIDVRGAMQVKRVAKALKINCVFVFIVPPSIAELKRRLIARRTDTRDSIETRLKNAREELQHVENYDYVVVNDKIEDAVDKVNSIIKAEKCKIRRE